MKFLINTTKYRKKWKIKLGTKNKGNKQKRVLNLSISHSVMFNSLRLYGLQPASSFVHGILQVRIQELVAIPFSRGLPNPGIEHMSPALQADSLSLSHQGSLVMNMVDINANVSIITLNVKTSLQLMIQNLLRGFIMNDRFC